MSKQQFKMTHRKFSGSWQAEFGVSTRAMTHRKEPQRNVVMGDTGFCLKIQVYSGFRNRKLTNQNHGSASANQIKANDEKLKRRSNRIEIDSSK